MNVGYKHTPYNYKSSTASGLIVSKDPPFPQKHRPAKFSGCVLEMNLLFQANPCMLAASFDAGL